MNSVARGGVAAYMRGFTAIVLIACMCMTWVLRTEELALLAAFNLGEGGASFSAFLWAMAIGVLLGIKLIIAGLLMITVGTVTRGLGKMAADKT